MAVKSWVASANDPATDFPLANLPYGVFKRAQQIHIGIAIGDQVLDLDACASEGLLAALESEIVAACQAKALNALMSLGPQAWAALRRRITALLVADEANEPFRNRLQAMMIPIGDVEMQLPARIGDYTDFYASIHHATRVGKLFRPDNPLLPNYKYVPIGYHGRASSIVVSGHPIQRPSGQTKPPQAAEPTYGAAQSIDYELEVGLFIGSGNALGQSIPIAEAEQHIFGLCLVNDWSARDIQSWEYQPLGPFLAKNFATSISPWVVPFEALVPCRQPVAERPAGDPIPLAYLRSPHDFALDLTLDVFLQSRTMREADIPPMRVSRGNLKDLYWTLSQLVTHHAGNGCNLRPGDLIATGTISGPKVGSEGCLLEMKHRPESLRLPTGELRTFLEDGDEVTLQGFAEGEGRPRIGFGVCKGTISAPQQ